MYSDEQYCANGSSSDRTTKGLLIDSAEVGDSVSLNEQERQETGFTKESSNKSDSSFEFDKSAADHSGEKNFSVPKTMDPKIPMVSTVTEFSKDSHRSEYLLLPPSVEATSTAVIQAESDSDACSREKSSIYQEQTMLQEYKPSFSEVAGDKMKKCPEKLLDKDCTRASIKKSNVLSKSFNGNGKTVCSSSKSSDEMHFGEESTVSMQKSGLSNYLACRDNVSVSLNRVNKDCADKEMCLSTESIDTEKNGCSLEIKLVDSQSEGNCAPGKPGDETKESNAQRMHIMKESPDIKTEKLADIKIDETRKVQIKETETKDTFESKAKQVPKPTVQVTFEPKIKEISEIETSEPVKGKLTETLIEKIADRATDLSATPTVVISNVLAVENFPKPSIEKYPKPSEDKAGDPSSYKFINPSTPECSADKFPEIVDKSLESSTEISSNAAVEKPLEPAAEKPSTPVMEKTPQLASEKCPTLTIQESSDQPAMGIEESPKELSVMKGLSEELAVERFSKDPVLSSSVEPVISKFSKEPATTTQFKPMELKTCKHTVEKTEAERIPKSNVEETPTVERAEKNFVEKLIFKAPETNSAEEHIFKIPEIKRVKRGAPRTSVTKIVSAVSPVNGNKSSTALKQNETSLSSLNSTSAEISINEKPLTLSAVSNVLKDAVDTVKMQDRDNIRCETNIPQEGNNVSGIGKVREYNATSLTTHVAEQEVAGKSVKDVPGITKAAARRRKRSTEDVVPNRPVKRTRGSSNASSSAVRNPDETCTESNAESLKTSSSHTCEGEDVYEKVVKGIEEGITPQGKVKGNRNFFMEKVRANELKGLTVSELEEFIVKKVCDAMDCKNELEVLYEKQQSVEDLIVKWRTKTLSVCKQLKDMELVLDRYKRDLKAAKGRFVMPAKVTRSVALQVSMHDNTPDSSPRKIHKRKRIEQAASPGNKSQKPGCKASDSSVSSLHKSKNPSVSTRSVARSPQFSKQVMNPVGQSTTSATTARYLVKSHSGVKHTHQKPGFKSSAGRVSSLSSKQKPSVSTHIASSPQFSEQVMNPVNQSSTPATASRNRVKSNSGMKKTYQKPAFKSPACSVSSLSVSQNPSVSTRSVASSPQFSKQVMNPHNQSTIPETTSRNQNLVKSNRRVKTQVTRQQPFAVGSNTATATSPSAVSNSRAQQVTRSKPNHTKGNISAATANELSLDDIVDLTDDGECAEPSVARTTALISPVNTKPVSTSNLVVGGPLKPASPLRILQQPVTTAAVPAGTDILTSAATGNSVPRLTNPIPTSNQFQPRPVLLSSSTPQVDANAVATVTGGHKNRASSIYVETGDGELVSVAQIVGIGDQPVQTSVCPASLQQVATPNHTLLQTDYVLPTATLSGHQYFEHPAPLPLPHNPPNNPEWKKMPPMPEVKIARQARSQGIAISWNLDLSNEHAEIASYQLYAYQESAAAPNTDHWKKVGDIKALPLPMACTLTKFIVGHKYHFAVRAIDIHSRVGPFSIPGNILLTRRNI